MTTNSSSAPIFPILFLIGRPAAGKSEVIKYLRSLDPLRRERELHIGAFHELDDFPMIWSWFEEDDILARHGRPRLHTDPEGYFLDNFLWNVLIERLDLEYRKWAKEHDEEQDSLPPTEHTAASTQRSTESEAPNTLAPPPPGRTAIIEFARGAEHGGFREAFSHFSPDLLRRGAVLYIKVSYSESLRKNRRRFNPDKPHSILEHSLPDDKLERMYRDSDWEEISGNDPSCLEVSGVRIPYVAMENDDDVTTGSGEALGRRLTESLGALWQKLALR